jgi:hypothetical protein
MESSNDEKKNTNRSAEQPLLPDELSEAWRALLGQPAQEMQEGAIDANLAEPLAGDPWRYLLNAQGMQTVDLQKVHLRDLYPEASDEDVEHALNLMREATGKLRALNEQKKEPEG